MRIPPPNRVRLKCHTLLQFGMWGVIWARLGPKYRINSVLWGYRPQSLVLLTACVAQVGIGHSWLRTGRADVLAIQDTRIFTIQWT